MGDIETLALHHRVSQFLFHEARLLDEQNWEEWEALFTDDGVYWAPATPGQPDPVNHVSLIYEDRLLRKVRIARFASPAAYSLQPFPRTVHQLSNIMIDRHDPSSGEVSVTSRFLMIEYRRGAQHYFGGAYIHDLAESDGAFKIRRKKADLVNCEGPLVSSSVYF
jgi:benzoate/toluate 1,2-dioxygenase beta subunit